MKRNHLYILGPAELRTADGKLEHSFLAGPKRLTLLSILIMHQKGGFVRRDWLLPMFWPDRDQKSARNALSNMLYHIRKSLGADVLHTRGSEELSVDPERLWCDVTAFEHAIDQGELQEAVNLYRGNLLEGFHLKDVTADLEHWLDHERDRIHSSYMDALETLAIRSEERENFREAASWWKKVASEDPLDTRVIKRWVESIAASGRYAEAFKRSEEHGILLEKELGFDAEEIRSEITENLNRIRLTASRSHTARVDMNKIASIAVLPFEELGSAPEISYLASGLHHDLLTRLAGVSGLKVISRTSVLRYKKTEMTIPEIAEQLGVDTVVEGAIQQSGEQLRLHIQTINAGNDEHEVSETFDRTLTTENLFDIQSDLAEKIANNLKTFLTPKEKKRAFEWSFTENAEAYRYYSMGRRQLDRRTESSMRKSLEYFKKAVDTDPDYALAWVGLCDAHTLLYDYGHDSGDTRLQEASRAVECALELDPDLAEAHASMGLLHSNRHEGPDAIRELLISVELQPNYAEAHNWLSWNYQLLGEADKALESARTAVELDPLSPEAVSNLATSLLYNGFTEESLKESRRAVELEPDWMTSAFYCGLALYQLKETRKAAAVLKDIESPWAGAGPKATFAVCRYELGDKKTARDILSEFESEERWFAAGLLHAVFGRYEKATEYFRKIRFWDDWPTLAFYYLYTDILSEIKKGKYYPELLKNVKKSRGLVSDENKSPVHQPDEKKIAVFPFRNLGDQKDSPGFTAGLHFDLISMLSKVPDLTVISGGSMQNVGQDDRSLRDLTRRFGVGTAIKGSVQLVRDRLRLNIQCVNMIDEGIRWAETFDRKLTPGNLFEIQSGLADRISESLHQNLIREEIESSPIQKTENLDAYMLCVQGRTHLARRNEPSVNRALNLFLRALDNDPDYPPALSGYAESVAILQEYRYPIPDQIPDPFTAARKALDLDPSLCEAHTALGVLHVQQKNLPDGIREFEQAVKFKPGNADANNWLGWARMLAGDINRAVHPAERGKELNPMVPYTRAFLGEVYLAAGRYESALKESRAARELQPDYAVAILMEAVSLCHLKRFREASFVLEEALQLVDDNNSPPRSFFQMLSVLVKARSAKIRLDPGFPDNVPSDYTHFYKGLLFATSGDIGGAIASFKQVKIWEPYPTAIIRYMFPDILGPVRTNKQFDKIRKSVDQSWGLE